MAEETINPLFTPLIEPLNSICFSNASIDNIYIKYEVFIRFIKSIQCKLNVHFEVNTVENIFVLLSKKNHLPFLYCPSTRGLIENVCIYRL